MGGELAPSPCDAALARAMPPPAVAERDRLRGQAKERRGGAGRSACLLARSPAAASFHSAQPSASQSRAVRLLLPANARGEERRGMHGALESAAAARPLAKSKPPPTQGARRVA